MGRNNRREEAHRDYTRRSERQRMKNRRVKTRDVGQGRNGEESSKYKKNAMKMLDEENGMWKSRGPQCRTDFGCSRYVLRILWTCVSIRFQTRTCSFNVDVGNCCFTLLCPRQVRFLKSASVLQGHNCTLKTLHPADKITSRTRTGASVRVAKKKKWRVRAWKETSASWSGTCSFVVTFYFNLDSLSIHRRHRDFQGPGPDVEEVQRRGGEIEARGRLRTSHRTLRLPQVLWRSKVKVGGDSSWQTGKIYFRARRRRTGADVSNSPSVWV